MQSSVAHDVAYCYIYLTHILRGFLFAKASMGIDEEKGMQTQAALAFGRNNPGTFFLSQL